MPTPYDHLLDSCGTICSTPCTAGNIFDSTPTTVGASQACIGPIPGNGDDNLTMNNCLEASTPCLADVLDYNRPFCGLNCWVEVCYNHCSEPTPCKDLDGNAFTFQVTKNLAASGTGDYHFDRVLNNEMLITLNYNSAFSVYYFPANHNLKDGTYSTPNHYDLSYATVWMRKSNCLASGTLPVDPTKVINPPVKNDVPQPIADGCISLLEGDIGTIFDRPISQGGKTCGAGYFHDNTAPYTGFNMGCVGVFLGDGDDAATCNTSDVSTNKSPCVDTVINNHPYFCENRCWYKACQSTNGNISGDCGGFLYQAYNTDSNNGYGYYIFNKTVNEKIVLTQHTSDGTNGDWSAFYFPAGSGLLNGSYRTYKLNTPIHHSAVWRYDCSRFPA